MNIQAIKDAIAEKAGINLPTLMLSLQKDQTSGEVTPWLSHWDNDKRVRITMHTELAEAIKATPTIDSLAYKMEVVPEHENVKAYTRFVVINPTSVVMTF